MKISEYLNNLKAEKHFTNQQIADLSGVPIGTVNRLLSGQAENPTFFNVADIVKVLGGSLDAIAGISCDQTSSKNYIYDKSHEDRLVMIYSQSLRDKNKWIIALFILLSILLVGIISIVIYDISNLDIGYIRQLAARDMLKDSLFVSLRFRGLINLISLLLI